MRSLSVDEPFLRQTNVHEYYHSDGLGSPLALTNAAGGTNSSYSYDPFGKTTPTGSSLNSVQFTGRENDGMGLYHYRSRYYSPQLHRFLGEDPIGISGGLNLYSYVANNPVNRVDPSGEVVQLLAPDTYVDLAFIGYDLFRLTVDGRKNVKENILALGADIAGAVVPGITGLGLGVRVAKGGDKINDAVKSAEEFLGKNPTVITNKAGDKVFLSEDGTKRIRFDINNPWPHESPHAHVEQSIDGKWTDIGPRQIYPSGVPKR